LLPVRRSAVDLSWCGALALPKPSRSLSNFNNKKASSLASRGFKGNGESLLLVWKGGLFHDRLAL